MKKLNLDAAEEIFDDDVINVIKKLGKQLTTFVFGGFRLTDVAFLSYKIVRGKNMLS